jgi:hypothetical protein
VEEGENVETKQLKRKEWVEALQFLVKLKTIQQQQQQRRTSSVNTGSSSTTTTIQY